MVLALLPVVTLGVLVRVFEAGAESRRRAALSAIVAWGAVVVAITESLSLLGSFRRPWVIAVWSVAAVLFVLVWRHRARIAPPPPPRLNPVW